MPCQPSPLKKTLNRSSRQISSLSAVIAGVRRVNIAAVAHDFDPLHERNDRRYSLWAIRTSAETTPAIR
jgi:hypothetical protein